MSTVDTTLTPPEDLEELLDVSRFLQQHDGAALLLGPDGEQIQLPASMYEALRAVVESMRRGQAISLVPRDQTMTTQEAADFLGISRPTFVKALNAGEIPFEQSGPRAHRRVHLADVLSYRERQRHARREILTGMVEEAVDGGLYDVDAADYAEALRAVRHGR